MKIRALFLDIDGTLLNSSHLIGSATRQRLLSFQKQGEGSYYLLPDPIWECSNMDGS